MTAKHRDPEYRANARIVQQQVRRAWARGDDVRCWRCQRIMPPGSPFDVGHIRQHGGPSLSNLAPEHRYKGIGCQGNRAHGGRSAHRPTSARDSVPRPSPGSLPW